MASGLNIVNICRVWSRLRVSFKNLLCAVKFSTRVVRHSPPSKRREAALRAQTSLTHGEVFVKPPLEAGHQLPPWSQPAVSPVWQMTLTSAHMRTFYWLTHMAAVEGRGWRVAVQVWRMRGLFPDCILYSTNLRQAWTDKLPWWHHCARPLQKHVMHRIIFSITRGFIPGSHCAVELQYVHTRLWTINAKLGNVKLWHAVGMSGVYVMAGIVLASEV